MDTILVVDDNDEMRRGIILLLEGEGYTTIEADNGLTALEIVNIKRPHLIISDVMMPNMNGYILCERLQENPETASIPFIMMTGGAQETGAWESDPGVEYIQKPFDKETLLASIKKKLPPR